MVSVALLAGAGQLVIAVGVLPAKLLARLNRHGNEWFQRQDRADRPEDKLGQRPIAGNRHARSGLRVLNRESVICSRRTESFKFPEHDLLLAQLLQVGNLVATYLRQGRVGSTLCFQWKGRLDDKIRASGLSVQ